MLHVNVVSSDYWTINKSSLFGTQTLFKLINTKSVNIVYIFYYINKYSAGCRHKSERTVAAAKNM